MDELEQQLECVFKELDKLRDMLKYYQPQYDRLPVEKPFSELSASELIKLAKLIVLARK